VKILAAPKPPHELPHEPLHKPPHSDLQQLQQLDQRARRLGWWFLAYLLLYPLPWLGRPPSALDIAVSVLGVVVFLPLYLRGFGRSDARALGGGLAVAAIGLALQPFGGIWGVFIVYGCGLLGGVLPRRRAGWAIGGVALAVAALVLLRGLPLWDWLPTLFFGAMTAMVSLYSQAYTAQNEALAASRDEARRLAVVAERERIARDLHDLLGHTLTAVAVKADLAGRLLDADPADAARARAEIEDIRRTARSALADVRAAVTGMRSTRLANELAAARRALDSAGIAFSVQGVPPALPEPVETALAFVLLEGVTNVVRHAQAQQCRIDFGVQDGAVTLLLRDSRRAAEALPAASTPALPGTGAAPPVEGHGIAGMRQRLAAVGGTLALQFGPEGGALLARVPLPPAAGGVA
jgi:two-component system sensor histidine kinase DesK